MNSGRRGILLLSVKTLEKRILLPRPSCPLLVKIVFAVLLLAVPQAVPAAAESDLKSAWTRYRTSCKLHLAQQKVWDNLKAQSEEAKRKWREYKCWNADAGNQYCEKFVAQVLHNRDTLATFKPWLEESRNACETNRQAYSTALSESVVEAMLTGADPNPNAATRRTPSKNVERPYRRRRRPPNRGFSDAEAAAIIGGIIIQGIKKGTKRGNKRSHPSSRPGYIP